MNINIKKASVSALVIWITSSIFGWLTCGWLFNWIYFIEPTYIWKPEEAMMDPTNMFGMNLAGLLAAILFVLVFAILFKGIPKTGAKKGMTYGFLVWLVAGLSGMIGMPFYMNTAPAVVVYWIINALIANIIHGAIVGTIYKE